MYWRNALRVTCIVRDGQLRLYGHVARLSAEDPAHQILSCRDPEEWILQRCRPRAVCSRQVESYLRDLDMKGRVCVGDGQTEAEGVPSQDGGGDALLWRMSPYLT